ncbi:hypothetical protein PC121_g3541 [Phytophthora cactorum]|nr:hypothetical protein PC120_g7317 [Phytophthora cactorum]KAG3092580.1 hypothetical protein PC121_g3541 [Phytophthora cactorum]
MDPDHITLLAIHRSKAIKVEKPNKIKCDADELQLLARNDDGQWLNISGAAAITLDQHGYPQGFGQMTDRTLFLKNSKNFGVRFQPSKDEVHVLVVILFLQNKQPRLTKLKDIPAIDFPDDDYVKLPDDLVNKCGLKSEGDLILYCRHQVRHL